MGRILWAGSVGLMFSLCSRAQSPTNTQLTVQVRSEATLAWQSGSVVWVKVRLVPGTQARLWVDNSCATPPADVHVITASGTYTVPVISVESEKMNVCLISSDGNLRKVLSAPGK